MKSVKNHISVIFPLFVILLSLQFTFGLEKVVKKYESRLVEDYSIVVVSVKPLKPESVESTIQDFKSLEPMDTKKVLKKLKGEITEKNLTLLQIALPKFYSLKLDSFPSTNKLNSIKKRLQNLPSVTKVETFSKTHDKIYRIFVIAKITAYIFTAFILVISFLLMLKQMKIWVYEHKERMDIMSLFGAPFWMKSAVLYRRVAIDSVIATVVSLLSFFILSKSSFVQDISKDIDIIVPEVSILSDGVLLLVIALVFSIFSVSMVMIRIKKG